MEPRRARRHHALLQLEDQVPVHVREAQPHSLRLHVLRQTEVKREDQLALVRVPRKAIVPERHSKGESVHRKMLAVRRRDANQNGVCVGDGF